MSVPEHHPKLLFRPHRHPGLNRPKLHHPILGPLEYVNQAPGWWQGAATISGTWVRIDLQLDANPSNVEIANASDLLLWVQQNEASIRSYILKNLSAGLFRSNFQQAAGTKLDDPVAVAALRPAMIVLWPTLAAGLADLQYQCDLLPEGTLLGADTVRVDVDVSEVDRSKSLRSVFLCREDFRHRAERFFDRPLPPAATDFENSVADQLIAKAARGTLQLDAELRRLLAQALELVDGRMRAGSLESAAYLMSAKRLLSDISRQDGQAN